LNLSAREKEKKAMSIANENTFGLRRVITLVWLGTSGRAVSAQVAEIAILRPPASFDDGDTWAGWGM